MIIFANAKDVPCLAITDGVLEHIQSHRQTKCWKPEAGGQLFARFENDLWIVERATGPKKSDLRSRFGFRPNRKAEQQEIYEAYADRLHFVGDWHTHPQPRPHPSPDDFESVAEMVRLSTHELPGFVMVIVGTETSVSGLWVSFHSRNESYCQLQPIQD